MASEGFEKAIENLKTFMGMFPLLLDVSGGLWSSFSLCC